MSAGRLSFVALAALALAACGSKSAGGGVDGAADSGEPDATAEDGADTALGPDLGTLADAAPEAPATACVAPTSKQVWGRQLFDRTVYSVAVVAEDDIWRGDDLALWHWDGSAWTKVFTQTSGYYFDSLLGFGAHDVWSLGDMRLRQWDGQLWRDRSPPFPANVVWGPSSSDLWALAIIPKSTPNRSTVMHWDGAGWTERAPPTPPAGASVVLNGIWGAAPDDMWAVGHTLRAGNFGATALRWNGSAWIESGDSSAPDRASLDFLAVGGLSKDDVWAVAAGPAAASGQLWHFANGGWTKSLVVPSRTDLAQTPQRAVFWSGCPGTLWLAVGGFVASYDGSSWSAFTKMPSTFLFAMSGLGNRLLLAGDGNGDQSGALLTNAPDGPGSCGNARLDPGEQCDPPDEVACSPSCQLKNP